MDRMNLTMEQIEDCIVYWRSRMGLSDWVISYSIVTQADIPNKYADVEWNLSRREATIQISNPKTWPTYWGQDEDMENSIVHELYHLVNAPLLSTIQNQLTFTKVETEILTERPTETMAALLVKLRRQAGHKFDWERKPKKK